MTNNPVLSTPLDAEVRHAAAAVFERFELTHDGDLATQHSQIAPKAVLVYSGIDNTGGMGEDHIEWLNTEVVHFKAGELGRPADQHSPENVPPFRLSPDAGEWPLVVEAFKVYDPKHNPPAADDTMDRFFLTLRLVRIEGEIYLAVYHEKKDALADSVALKWSLDG